MALFGFAILSAAVAHHKRLCVVCYFWTGLFFGPIAYLIALVMPMRYPPKAAPARFCRGAALRRRRSGVPAEQGPENGKKSPATSVDRALPSEGGLRRPSQHTHVVRALETDSSKCVGGHWRAQTFVSMFACRDVTLTEPCQNLGETRSRPREASQSLTHSEVIL